MASETIQVATVFPTGTSVGARLLSTFGVYGPQAGTAPPGSADASATVAADGTLAFSGLTAEQTYVASAQVDSVWKHLRFTTLTSPFGKTTEENTFTAAQHLTASAPSTSIFDVGQGTSYGAPAAGPTVATGAAGALTGDYQYVYTETDYFGETTASPASSTVSPSSQKVTVTLPQARRGVSSRKLYRTKAGVAGTYYFVSALSSGGSGYHLTKFTDNLADGSLGSGPPSSDSTRQQQLIVANDNVVYLRNSPSAPSTADLTLLTADPSGTGLAVDSYGCILSRTRNNHSFSAERTVASLGDGIRAFRATYMDGTAALDAQTAPTPVECFYVDGSGQVGIKPQADITPLKITPFSSASTSSLVIRNAGDSADVVTVNKDGQTKIAPSADTGALILTSNASTAATILLALQRPGGTGADLLDVTATGKTTIRTSTDVNPAFQVVDNAGTTWLAVRTDTGATTIAGTANLNLGANINGANLAIQDARNVTFGTTTGTKLGTATTQKVGFYGVTPVVQQARPTDTASIIAAGTALGIWA